MGYFNDNTVEITFEGKKVRVSKDVADAIAKKAKLNAKKKNVKKASKK